MMKAVVCRTTDGSKAFTQGLLVFLCTRAVLLTSITVEDDVIEDVAENDTSDLET